MYVYNTMLCHLFVNMHEGRHAYETRVILDTFESLIVCFWLSLTFFCQIVGVPPLFLESTPRKKPQIAFQFSYLSSLHTCFHNTDLQELEW